MKITVFNAKGGVGKSTVSLNFHLTYDFNIVTNDSSEHLSEVCCKKKFLLINSNDVIPHFDKDLRIIFDLGGFIDSRIEYYFMLSEKIVIPVLPDRQFLKGTLDLIEEIRTLLPKKEIIIICNQCSDDDFTVLSNLFKYHFSYIRTFQLKPSKVFRQIWTERKSVRQLADEKPLHRRFFAPVADQFDDIYKHLTEQMITIKI